MSAAGKADTKLARISYSARLTPVLRPVYYSLVILVVLPLASVDPRPLHLFSLAFCVLAAIVLFVRPVPVNARFLFATTVIVAGVLASWIIVQTLDIPGNPFANPIWAQAEEFFGPMPRMISVAPGDSIEAMISVLLPFIVCITGQLLFSSDESAGRLLRVLALAGTAIAVFGLVQFIFFPEQLLFGKKTAYVDSLTAVFINRNTTATFLGVTLLVNVSLAFGHLQSTGLRDFFSAVVGGKTRMRAVDRRWTVLYAAASVLTGIALMLTRSRAGIGSSLLGLTVLLAILAYHGGYAGRSRHGFSAPQDPVWKRLGRVLAALLAVALIVSVFAGQAVLRLGVQSTADDGRFCVMPGLLRLLGDNWVVGTGLGTFRDVFPPYLDPECGIIGIWTRAHNVYIEGWINLGLPFVILATFFIISLFYVFLRGISARRRMRFVPALGLSALIIVLAHSALDFSLQIPGFAVFWVAVLTPCMIIASNRPPNQPRVPSILEVKQDG